MSDTRNVYVEPSERALLRTADVYQTEVDDGVEGYSDTLLAVVANFRNSGCPEGANAQSMAGKSKRGEVACRLFAVVNPKTRIIEQAGFKTRGCLAMTACASVACSMIEGRTLESALEVTMDDIRAALDGVPAGKSNTLYFAVCAIRGLVGDFLAREGQTLEQLDAIVPCDDYSVSCMMCEHCSLRDMRIEMQFSENSLAENNALALVFNDVRAQSANSALVSPSRWVDLGIVPEDMTAEDFEMFVYDYLTKWQAEHQMELEEQLGTQADKLAGQQTEGGQPKRIEQQAESDQKSHRSAAKTQPSKYASRSVGVPTLFANTNAENSAKANTTNVAEVSTDATNPTSAASTADISSATDAPNPADTAATSAPSSTSPTSPDDLTNPADLTNPIDNSDDNSDDPFASLNIPAGFKLVQLEGEWVLVETGENPQPEKLEIDSQNITILVGAHSYYLYDSSIMTNSYAHWAFLAAEGNPLITFADCVREESRLYPRPMALSCFANEPFCMNADEVESAWAKSQEHPDYSDLFRIEASNGDVYFYSQQYLSEPRAKALAEWDAVERYRNV